MMIRRTHLWALLLLVAVAPLACSRKGSSVAGPGLDTTGLSVPGAPIILDADTLFYSNNPNATDGAHLGARVYPGFNNGSTGDIEYQCGGTSQVVVNYIVPAKVLTCGSGYVPGSYNTSPATAAQVNPKGRWMPSGSYGYDGTNNLNYVRFFGRNGTKYYSPSLGLVNFPVADALGVGQPVGAANYDTDFYTRWQGYKVGGNTSIDYANITFYFNALRSPHPGADMRRYHGFTFYARGHGNFGVGLNAGANGGLPYKDYNVFELVFGDQLIDDLRWRQVIVYFEDMKQLFLGKGYVNINDVLADLSGLQFQQEAPVTQQFQLDLDYIRFF